MALRDQPYLPLYIKDFATDEKLALCSASATGVYIRIMCLMHKSKEYGKILLKQKHKQNSSKVLDFAKLIAKSLPYDVDTIFASLEELLDEDVLQIEGDFLCQKRMIKDGEISANRSISGSSGGKKTQEKIKKIAKANNEANSEYEIEYIYTLYKQLESIIGEDNNEYSKSNFMYIVVEMVKLFKEKQPEYFFDKETDYSACLKIAYNIAQMKGWRKQEVLNGKMNDTLESWKIIIDFINNDSWFSKRSLSDISTVKEWQRLVQSMTKNKQNEKQMSDYERKLEADRLKAKNQKID